MNLIPWILLALALLMQLWSLPTLIRRQSTSNAAWMGAVPGLHFWAWLKVIERPWYWLFFLLIPGINLLMLTIMHVELGLVFGRRSVKDQWIMGALPWWGLWELQTASDPWVGKRDWSNTRKSTVREWSEALIWATVVASSLRLLTFEPFTIPTPSMEGSMLVGDYLLVSKTAYGPKLPRTPFSMPFVHNALPGGLTPSYTSWFSLPDMRLPGWRKVERNDAVVFSFPHGDTVYVDPQLVGHDYYALLRREGIKLAGGDVQKFALEPERYLAQARKSAAKKPGLRARPIDKMENYVKRCVALPGETVEVIDGDLHIDGQPADNPAGLQKEYRVVFQNQIQFQQAFQRLGLTNIDLGGGTAVPEGIAVVLALTEERAEAIVPLCEEVTAMSMAHRKGRLDMFPNVWNEEFNEWEPDNYGPITLPKRGETIPLNRRNLDVYRRWITAYEDHSLEERPDGTVWIDGEQAEEFTFGMDGYWMMGDNRHRSADSRMWGFVPENHIVGCASFIWFSKQNEAQHGQSNIRWDRIMTKVK
ncbi:MAG: S26 family signal peptidase [Bacteroidetes bacterium]|nr:S26 family signal peptidase [Bacteroidota bacterium]MDA0903074.1 S26 family signal peptidase [Bacteroidota bacterium]MDA1241716.1 S26 family signal peptidase [Bacteroidota bacterium]